MSISEAVDDFAAHLLDYERLQPTTIRNYTTYLSLLLSFLTPEEAERAVLGEITSARFSAFLRHERERGMAESTLQMRWYAVHAFYRFLRHRGYDGPSPLDQVRPPRARPVPRRDYSATEAEAILAAARASAEGGTKKGQFDYAVMATFRYTGVRRGELVDAKVKDLDLPHRELTVLGKGRKRRTIPLPHPYVEIMEWYLAEVRPHLPGSERLFANPRANIEGRFRGATDGQSLKRMVVRYGEDAAVPGPHLPHRWRHTYATHLLRRGVDVAVVQKLLGHSSITTTSIYLHLVRDDLQAGVDQAFGGPPQRSRPDGSSRRRTSG
ncbi:tyrosine-type recombinase/integrase [Quadrisphaera oryzae]|uniref:tyrosine-type recombinase/integrase n=1 Tax=Quadrisphaera TaxID=317661 RepID=UPI001649558D|nr:tyrosine-type recombinase/integrase [Quadrisphaera sp. RL12-1S]MBC3762929.1 tyrosine-type recombinase/integrase [Quadrisphaera sp. RL12-1S]